MSIEDNAQGMDVRSDEFRSFVSDNVSKMLHINLKVVREHLDTLEYNDLLAQFISVGDNIQLLNQLESRLADSLFREKPMRLFKAILLGRSSMRHKYEQAKDPLLAYLISFAILPLKCFSKLKTVSRLPAWILLPILLIFLPTFISCLRSDALAVLCAALSIWVWLAGTLFTLMLVFPLRFSSVAHTAGQYVERFQGTTSLARALTNVGVCLMIIVTSFAAFYTLLDSRAPGYHFHVVSHSQYPFDSFLYFSLMTITTVGYGDIYPLSSFARLITSVEVLQGVIMFAVILAYTIGVYNSKKAKGN